MVHSNSTDNSKTTGYQLDDIMERFEKSRQLAAERTAAKIASFQPSFANCDKHGCYQQNQMDERTGNESWLPDCPECNKERQLQGLMARAGIPPRFRIRSLDSYDCDNPGQQRALAICRRYVDEFADRLANGHSLIMSGSAGTGKTHLAIGIAIELLRVGRKIRYGTVSDIIRELRQTWGDDAQETEQDWFKRMISLDLLVIDEIGVQYGTESEQIILFEIINKRYEQMKPLLIMSNLPIKATEENKGLTLQKYLGERAYDRLCEGGALIKFDWPSHRRSV